MTQQIGDAEKIYLLHGIEEDFRVSGRTRQEFRQIQIEMNVDPSKVGSAKVSFDGTTTMVTVEACTRQVVSKDASESPPTDKSDDEGTISLRVHFAACPLLGTDREIQRIRLQVERLLLMCLKYFDKKQLCIAKGKCVWDIHICVNVLQFNGNAQDATSVGLLAALAATQLPDVSISLEDDKTIEVELTDPVTLRHLKLEKMPVLVTVFKTGTNQIVDADLLEEAVSFSRVIVAVNRKGQVVSVDKDGIGSLTLDSVTSMIREAKTSSVELFAALNSAVKPQRIAIETTACNILDEDQDLNTTLDQDVSHDVSHQMDDEFD